MRWNSRFADRTAGNVLNYGGFTSLQQGTDGKFTVLPTPPDDLFAPDRTSTFVAKPGISALTQNYELAADRLIWQPAYNPGGFAGSTERALLLADRWLVLREDTDGLYLQERPRDPTASYPDNTFIARGPRILGQQADLFALSDSSSPLIPAAGGGYWLLGRANTVMQIGPISAASTIATRSPDSASSSATSAPSPTNSTAKRSGRNAPPSPGSSSPGRSSPLACCSAIASCPMIPPRRSARLRPPALLYLALALLAAYWFWTATAFF